MDDTISAIATPIGEGALAIVRISGPQALAVASSVFRAGRTRSKVFQPEEFEARRVYFGVFVDKEEVVDEILLTIFRAPKSYTCEDMCEISSHGGPFISGIILTGTLKAGCRPAAHGEFTRRAFLNGRIDLTQAEAVGEIIRSNSEPSRQASIQQLQGSLTKVVMPAYASLLNCLASVEASIDFPDDDTMSDPISSTLKSLNSITETISEIISQAEASQRMRNGARVVVAGIPNSGKSTLFNSLVGHDRAIVSAVLGTTRDSISECVMIGGRSYHLVDTAGLRSSENDVERQGIERTIQACRGADLILHVVDPTQGNLRGQIASGSELGEVMRITVLSKIDLIDPLSVSVDSDCKLIQVSALTGYGLGDLRSALVQALSRDGRNAANLRYLVGSRHLDCLTRCSAYVDHATRDILAGYPCDVIASNIRLAAQSLGEVLGVTVSEDTLNKLFSQFCIGK